MNFKYRCDPDCRSARCPAALERIAAGWRNGVTPPNAAPQGPDSFAESRRVKQPEDRSQAPADAAPSMNSESGK